MDLYTSLGGMVQVELTGADIGAFLACVTEKGILLDNLQPIDSLSVCVRIRRKDHRAILSLARKKGVKIKLRGREGVYWSLKSLLGRPVLLFGAAVMLFLVCWLPGRVLFVSVEGNSLVPTRLILETARGCGISFGASRREVRSEKMKNKLLETIPQLQWAGVNTTGCTAVISVKERADPALSQQRAGVSSIVAGIDGVIESFTATRGNALCTVGQAVKAGQTLISGYTDCGISIRATRAEGEIIARTMRDLTVITPLRYGQKGEISGSVKKYSLIIGKKRINLLKDSGICGTTCDKMYREYYLTLPGGFQLPVALAVEQWSCREEGPLQVSAGDAQSVASHFGNAYILTQMVSGQILESVFVSDPSEDVYIQHVRFLCREMIGRVHSEEILDNYGKNN